MITKRLYRHRILSLALPLSGLCLAACGDDDVDMPIQVDAGMSQVDSGQEAQAPEITTAEIAAAADNVLRATITVETDMPTMVAVEVRGDNLDPWTIPIADTMSMSHSIPVIGMRAETDYDFVVTVENADGLSAENDELTLTTEALPAKVPSVSANVMVPAQVAAGFTLFGISYFGPDTAPGSSEGNVIVAVDGEGEVVWYHESELGIDDIRQLDNGNLLFITDHRLVIEMDMMGNEVRRITNEDVGIDSFHHEIFVMPSGNFLTLSSDLRTVEYTEEGVQVDYPVVADVVVEFTPAGEVVQEVNLFDLLDTQRIIRPSFDTPFWDRHYDIQGTKDWTHGNAVVADPADDNYVVSLRHQDWLLKIDRESGAILWKLGDIEGDFELVGEGGFAYHHHAPEYQDGGSLLVYDNGNTRPPETAGDPPFSRAVEFTINEDDMEITQAWEYRGETPFFTPAVGDADRLDNGNVLIVAGSLSNDPTNPFGVATFTRISEVTYATPAEVVMELTIEDPPEEPDFGTLTYRAERIPSLYPPL